MKPAVECQFWIECLGFTVLSRQRYRVIFRGHSRRTTHVIWLFFSFTYLYLFNCSRSLPARVYMVYVYVYMLQCACIKWNDKINPTRSNRIHRVVTQAREIERSNYREPIPTDRCNFTVLWYNYNQLSAIPYSRVTCSSQFLHVQL